MSIRKSITMDQVEWSVGPPPSWVVPRRIDWSWRAPDGHGVACFLLDEQHDVATQSRSYRSVRQVLSLPAVQALGQVEIEFEPVSQRIQLHELVVWRPDVDGEWRRRQSVPRESFLLRQREQQLEQQMLNGHVSLVALIEDLRVGDAIDLAWTLEPREPLPGLRFTALYAFAWSVPVASALVSFRLPEDRDRVRWRVHCAEESIAPVAELAEDRVQWTFDHPPVFQPEANVPSSHWAFPLLEITAWDSWAEVSRFFRALWADALTDDVDAVSEQARRLGDGVLLPEAIGRAIRFVQEEIRYLAVDFGQGAGLLPSGAGAVLRRRFGDCKDKSVLLCALLRELGVEARPALVNAAFREGIERLHPSASHFNHAIVAFDFEGVRRFVDPTLIGMGGDLARRVSPPYGAALELGEDVDGLIALPGLCEADLSLTETFNLDRYGGDGFVEQELHATAWLADDIRAAIVSQGRLAFAKARADALRAHFPALVPNPDGGDVEDDLAANSIRLRSRHALPTWGPVGQKPPETFVYGAHGLFLAVESVDDREQRKQPWALRHPMRVHHRVVARGNSVRKVRSEFFEFEGPGFGYSCEVNSRRREAIFDYRWTSTAADIPAEQWGDYCRERAKALAQAGANVATPTSWTSPRLAVWPYLVFAIAIVAAAVGIDRIRHLIVASPSSSDRVFEDATASLAHGDYARAYDLSREIRRTHAASFEVNALFAESAVRSGRFSEAVDAIDVVRRLRPEDPLPELLAAEMDEAGGDLERARSRLITLAEGPNPLDRVLLDLARISERMGDRNAARTALRTLSDRQPAHPEALYRLARLAWEDGERARSDAWITDAIASIPRPSADLQSTLARHYLETGRADEAIEHSRKAADLRPDDPFFEWQYVATLVRADRPKSAVEVARVMKKRFPDHPLAWGAVAMAAAGAGDDLAAEPAFKAWLRMTPWDPEAHWSYGHFLYTKGRVLEARRLLELAVSRFPTSPRGWSSYSLVLDAVGEKEQAAAAREKVRELSHGPG